MGRSTVKYSSRDSRGELRSGRRGHFIFHVAANNHQVYQLVIDVQLERSTGTSLGVGSPRTPYSGVR